MGPVSAKCWPSSIAIHITQHLPAEIHPNRTIHDRVMVSYPFLRWRHNIGILLLVSVFLRSLILEGRSLPAYQILVRYLNPWLRYYYFWFLKTNVRHVGILVSVPFWRLRHHRHVILHLPTKFCPNLTIRDRVMTSHPFFKMAATASQFYFWFCLSWLRSSRKVEIYVHTKFWRDTSIHGWDITNFGFWKQTSFMLEFYFQFWFLRFRHHRHVILHLPTKFRPNQTIRNRVMMTYPFSKMAATAS